MPDTDRTPFAGPCRTVLIVDDDRDNAEMLTLLLAAEGYEVHAVHDGLHALPAVERLLPDAVLLDLDLPGRDGFDVARKVRSLGVDREMLLVATTGWSRREDRETAEVCGFDHFLAKPLDLDRLLDILRHMEKKTSGLPSAR